MIFNQTITIIFFFLIGVFVASVGFMSPAIKLKYLVGYNTSDFVTFYEVLKNQSIFNDTITLEIAKRIKDKSLFIYLIQFINIEPENLFIITYFLQNFLLTFSFLILSWAITERVDLSILAFGILLMMTNGYVFSIRSKVSFISLSLIIISFSFILQNKKLQSLFLNLVTFLFHPTQFFIFYLSTCVTYVKKNKFSITTFFLISSIVMLCSLLLYDFLLNNNIWYQIDKETLLNFHNGTFPISDLGFSWSFFPLSLAFISLSSLIIYKATKDQIYFKLFVVFFSVIILNFFSLLTELPFQLPKIFYMLSISFRLYELYVPIAFCCVIGLLLKVFFNKEKHIILLVIFLNSLFLSNDLFKSVNLNFTYIEIFKPTLLYLSTTLLILTCDKFVSSSNKNLKFITNFFFILINIFYSINYANSYIIISTLTYYVLLWVKCDDFPSIVKTYKFILSFIILIFYIETVSKYDWSIRYPSELIRGDREVHLIKDRTKGRENFGPLFIVPPRKIELSPRYPSFLERLDTSYIAYFPELSTQILNRLKYYSPNFNTSNPEKLFHDTKSWRKNIRILQKDYPNLKYVATYKTILCKGEISDIIIKDRRNHEIHLVDIKKINNNC